MLAQQILDRGQVALEMLEEENDFARIPVLWTAGVAIARSVGHVLKIDAAADPQIERRLNQRWPQWKEEPIFKNFIEDERNLILKEGAGGFATSSKTQLTARGERFSLDHTIYWPMHDGPYAGEDCRDVLREALDWWQAKLSELASH